MERVSQARTCLSFLILLKFKEKLSVTEKNISDGKEMTETEVKDPRNIYRTASNPNIIMEKNVIIAAWQGKTPVSNLRDACCEGQASPHLLPKGKIWL